jgi:hypothetical protein
MCLQQPLAATNERTGYPKPLYPKAARLQLACDLVCVVAQQPAFLAVFLQQAIDLVAFLQQSDLAALAFCLAQQPALASFWQCSPAEAFPANPNIATTMATRANVVFISI